MATDSNGPSMAQAAYATYIAKLKNDDSLLLAACFHWHKLPENERAAWEAVVSEIRDSIEESRSTNA